MNNDSIVVDDVSVIDEINKLKERVKTLEKPTIQAVSVPSMPFKRKRFTLFDIVRVLAITTTISTNILMWTIIWFLVNF